MATGIRKAHIHHKDGNPLNNNPKNWEVLCAQCHRRTFSCEKKNHTGFTIRIFFQPWLREEILKTAHYQCKACGRKVQNSKFTRCDWCHQVTKEGYRVKWENGKIMCQTCLDEWHKLGTPRQFSPFIRGKNGTHGVAHFERLQVTPKAKSCVTSV